MERVKQFYQIVLLDEYYNLTAEEFERFQKECSEIAAFKSHGATGCTHCEHQDHDTKEFDNVADEPENVVEIHQDGISIDGREYLTETKSAHKAIAEVVKTGLETKPMKTNILKDRVDKMEPSNTKKDIAPYVKMHEDGVDMLAIKNQMTKDEFCAMNSIPYFAKKILAASTRVTKIEQVKESDEDKINRLKALNLAEAKKRQSPKVTSKFEKEIVE